MGAKHCLSSRGQIWSLALEIIIYGVETNLYIVFLMSPLLHSCILALKKYKHCRQSWVEIIYTELSMIKQCTLKSQPNSAQLFFFMTETGRR